MRKHEMTVSSLNELPLFKALGFRIVHLDETSVVLHLDEENPCYRGGFGVLQNVGVNGSVICAALEAAIGVCGYASLGHQPAGVIEFSAKILRIVRGGSPFIKAQVDRKSASLAFVSATLESARGGVCAQASGICALPGQPR
ncbi:PaaI family thioesterase [Vibrio coralliilyticus]|uniref:PaaI family thioesterase n=1 Tax=Vibrio coralliilyticus TaxID=190893 RepID=A0AAP6ZLQ1_9VIBR|nr:PaaI family thioesterase [Vibrio coralliilyticus]NOJ24169.1 PaaI family thioesterase [Vibrio coralliilyticus]